MLARSPSEPELTLGLAFLSQGPPPPTPAAVATPAAGAAVPVDAKTSGESMSTWEQYVQVVLLSNEFVFVD